MQKTLHSPEYKKLTAWLRAERIRHGLTIRELAEQMGVPHSFVGKVEQAERRLDVIEYIKYCHALGSPVEDGLHQLIDSN